MRSREWKIDEAWIRLIIDSIDNCKGFIRQAI